jgi:hypothetical protein
MWGQAAHLLYAHTRLKLGRLSSEFARHHLRHYYDMSPPAAFEQTRPLATATATATNTSTADNSVPGPNKDGGALRVVLFSRGGDGYGRTLMDEQKIVTHMNTISGVKAIMCCDFKTVSFDKQLAIAYHADVVSVEDLLCSLLWYALSHFLPSVIFHHILTMCGIDHLQVMGVHGAALVHSLFSHPGVITVEFKTQYAYESILFPIITELRGGVHVLIDIRSYHGFGPRAPGVPKPKPGFKTRGVVDDVSEFVYPVYCA